MLLAWPRILQIRFHVINIGSAHRHDIAAPQVSPAVTFVVSWPLKTKAESHLQGS